MKQKVKKNLHGWKPIKTAPENKRVLLFGLYYKNSHVNPGFLDKLDTWHLTRNPETKGWKWGLTFAPTHWRPLPKFPEI